MDTAETTMTPIQTAAFDSLARWMSLSRTNATALIQAFQGTMTFGLAVQKDFLDFAAMRGRKNIELAQALTQPRGADQSLQTLAQFTRSMLNDYVDELKKLAAVHPTSAVSPPVTR